MSSRVQKGSTVFRPVAKSRAKTAGPSVSRQPSAAVELTIDLSRDAALISDSFASSSSNQHLQDQYVPRQPVPPHPGPATAIGDVVNRPNIIAEEQYVAPRPPAIPPVIRSSIIGIPTRPVQLTPAPPSIITSQRNPQLINRPSVASTSTANPNGTNSAPSFEMSTGLLVKQTPPESTETNLPVPIGDSNSSPDSEITRPTIALTDSNSLDTLPGDESTPQNDAKGTTRRRKSQDENSKKPKRRRTGSKEADDVENEQEALPSKRSRSRTSSATPRPRKRAPSPPPYDPDADPGEEIDPTTVTMAALCSDTGQGRVSRKAAEILSNHAAWKTKNREKRARMRMLMEAKKYGKEEEEGENNDETENQDHISTNEAGPSASSHSAPVTDDTGGGFDYSQDLATSRFNVQVRIGPNGETVIDEESLVVDRAENDGTENYTHVVESDQTKFVNSGTYGKRYRGSRWSAEETELFYDALAQYGENYELIAYVLPGRDRKSCKNKFKVEDKRNHARINHSLNNSIPVDMKTLSRMTGKDFSGPVPEIRAPTPTPLPPPPPTEDADHETPTHAVKKRRSKSHKAAESGVVVIGDAENFES